MGKDAYYFSHDSNARFDPKILKLRAKYGLVGYGFYFCLLEIMRDDKNNKINKLELDTISFQLGVDESNAKAMLEFCLNIDLLKEDNNNDIFSESFLKRMDLMNDLRIKRVEAGRKGGNAKAMLKQSLSNAKAKLKQNSSKDVALKETKGKEKKEKEEKKIYLLNLRKENPDYVEKNLTDWQIEDVERMKSEGSY